MAAPPGDSFGDLLKAYRLAAHLTQEELAERAQLSARGLMYLERGARHPYRDTLRRLAEALGLDREAEERLQAAARDVPGGNAEPVPPRTLVGRERELALLRGMLAAAQAGRGGLVLISGEAGIGKTALAEAVLREAGGGGCALLVGHCFDLMETPPYGPFIDLFLRLPYPPAPDLPPLPPAFAARGTVGAVASQFALFAQVLDFLAAIGKQRPVVMLVEDLHWADSATLDLLRYLASSLATLPLLLLATHRVDELTRSHPLALVLPHLARAASAATLDLRHLDGQAVRALVEARYQLPDADAVRLAAYVQGRAEGNALFVGELLRALEEGETLARCGAGWRLGDLGAVGVPALLRQMINGRLERLDAESQRLLGIAAVIGQEVPLAVWAAVAGSDEGALLDAAEDSFAARLLVEAVGGEGMRFAHALVREAVYEGIPAVRRRHLHRRVGEAMAAARAPDPDAVAHHFQGAGDDRAVAWLIRAGERAQAAFAWPTAIARYEAAIALVEKRDGEARERGWLRYRVARLLRHTDYERALRVAREAEALADEADDRTLAAVTVYFRGHILFTRNRFAESLPLLASATRLLDALPAGEIERIDRQDATGTVTDMRGFAVMTLAKLGRFAEALAAAERAPVVPPPPGTPAVGLGDAPWRAITTDGYNGISLVYAFTGRYAEARASAMRAAAIADARRYSLDAVTARQHLLPIMLRYAADRGEELSALVDEAEMLFARAAGTVLSDQRGSARAYLDVLEGRWDAAEPMLDAITRERDWRWPWTMEQYGALKRARGKAKDVWGQVHAALPDGPATAPGTVRVELAWGALRLAAALALEARDLDAARGWIAAYAAWLDWSGAVLGRSEGEALWARYHRQSGDTEQARIHAERALRHAGDPRQPLALLAAHRLLGELDTEGGRFEDAVTHLDAARALADACHTPYERALTLLALAELRAATGDTGAALALLGEIQVICESLDAKPTLARVATLAGRLVHA